MAKNEKTAMMKQYHELKGKHPNRVLLFDCGDFYEAYGDDAEACAKELGIVLTKSKDSLQRAGFPHNALDTYLPKLCRAGHSVAICGQLEPPKPKPKRL